MEWSTKKRTDTPDEHLTSCSLGVPVENDLAEFPLAANRRDDRGFVTTCFENGNRVAVAVPGLSNGLNEIVTTAQKGLSP